MGAQDENELEVMDFVSGRGGQEEKIFVTVRVRPLSARELAHGDTSVWRCQDEHTLLYMEPVVDRSPYPAHYHFDRVFGPNAHSRQVYEEGARDVVLSALTGLNASIFAYGMTSSGKTYTMKGVTELAVGDIFGRIHKTPDREYIIHASAMEIYNEVVRDLLNPDSGALRLLDDPDRGTVVEKLSEVVVTSSLHLRQILAECESQRQVGETMLNDASSRSHQIVRLTVESCPRSPGGLNVSLDGLTGQVLIATLNFVDLAGSERASQTQSEGARLKEGGHINRSLLTLGTVIRKLSGGKQTKSGHIPYRDSKLTRILQHSLGGNARTSIICTMSPAHTHCDQTRNTLSFATRAKEVTNSAHVNLMVSDKVLVKQLQREVARLEAELKAGPTANDYRAQKLLISELEGEIAELAKQRDSARAQLREVQDSTVMRMDPKAVLKGPNSVQRFIRRSGTFRKGPNPSQVAAGSMYPIGSRVGPQTGGEVEVSIASEASKERRRYRKSVTRSSLALVSKIRKLDHLQDELGEKATRAMEALQREIECLRHAQLGMHHDAAETIANLQAEVADIRQWNGGKLPGVGEEEAEWWAGGDGGGAMKGTAPTLPPTPLTRSALRDEVSRLSGMGEGNKTDTAIASLEEQLDSAQLSIQNMCGKGGGAQDGCEDGTGLAGEAPSGNVGPGDIPAPPLRPGGEGGTGEGEGGGAGGVGVQRRSVNASVDVKRLQSLFKTAAEENIQSIRNYVTDLKERVAKLHFQKQLLVCQVLELEATPKEEAGDGLEGPIGEWALRFDRDIRAIVQLWDRCHVSLSHRTLFYLLIDGDPEDSMYLDVEQRRLAWLWEQSEEERRRGEVYVLNTRQKQLRRERQLIAKRMGAELSMEEREDLFGEWGIATSSKQRKQQLAAKVWSNSKDMQEVEASAQLVGHILGLAEDGSRARGVFGLEFKPPPGVSRGWIAQKISMSAL